MLSKGLFRANFNDVHRRLGLGPSCHLLDIVPGVDEQGDCGYVPKRDGCPLGQGDGRIMSSRSREIYIAKRKTLKKGDAELVQQVAEGKDIMSIFSAPHFY